MSGMIGLLAVTSRSPSMAYSLKDVPSFADT
jgi:hypothetical protein